MLDIILSRFDQGHRTLDFPAVEPHLPARFRGVPLIHRENCAEDCRACASACPTTAINLAPGEQYQLDLGRCLFCTDCIDACPKGAVGFSTDYRLAVSRREDLSVSNTAIRLARALEAETLRLFGRSLRLREVSAGGCNGCELDTNVLNNVVFDLSRFGIQFVASPRHADGLLLTGPVTQNMAGALATTYEAIPSPKIVIAVGACAISGGPYIDHPECRNGGGDFFKIDLYVPGCPPHPFTILDGLLRLIGKIK